ARLLLFEQQLDDQLGQFAVVSTPLALRLGEYPGLLCLRLEEFCLLLLDLTELLGFIHKQERGDRQHHLDEEVSSFGKGLELFHVARLPPSGLDHEPISSRSSDGEPTPPRRSGILLTLRSSCKDYWPLLPLSTLVAGGTPVTRHPCPALG